MLKVEYKFDGVHIIHQTSKKEKIIEIIWKILTMDFPIKGGK